MLVYRAKFSFPGEVRAYLFNFDRAFETKIARLMYRRENERSDPEGIAWIERFHEHLPGFVTEQRLLCYSVHVPFNRVVFFSTRDRSLSR